MDPDKIMEGLFKELDAALKGMAKAKTPEEKVQHSVVVKNLCDSLGVFLNMATEMMGLEDLED